MFDAIALPASIAALGEPVEFRLVEPISPPPVSQSAACAPPSTVGSAGALFVVTYVDFLQEILEDDPDEGQDKLVQYGAVSIKKNTGLLLSYTVLQQLDRPNRYVFLEVWDKVGDYNSWQGNPVTTDFVAKTMPLLGSPFDHRLNILCGETFVDGTGCVPP